MDNNFTYDRLLTSALEFSRQVVVRSDTNSFFELLEALELAHQNATNLWSIWIQQAAAQEECPLADESMGCDCRCRCDCKYCHEQD